LRREEREQIAPRPPGAGELPLSLAQERLWFLSRLDPGDASFALHQVYCLRGGLDPDALKHALGEVVARHEILRTRCPTTADGRPVRVVEPAWRAGLERIDLVGPADAERPARELVAERVNAPFDLADRPPCRATLLRLAGDDHGLCLVLHHVAADGWSVAVLRHELAALFAAFRAGEPSPLPPLPVQHADHALWQRRRPDAETHLAYWRERLAGAPALDPPADGPRPTGTSAGSAVVRRVDLGTAVDRLAREERCPPFMALLAAFRAVLGHASGQDDVCVGSPTAGRDHVELESLIGHFLHTLVLRGDLSGDPTFRDLLARTPAWALEMYAHGGVPFERLSGRHGRTPGRPVRGAAAGGDGRARRPALHPACESALTGPAAPGAGGVGCRRPRPDPPRRSAGGRGRARGRRRRPAAGRVRGARALRLGGEWLGWRGTSAATWPGRCPSP
jgi:Condensation domain